MGRRKERLIAYTDISPGHKFTQSLVLEVKAAIGRELSKRHIPKYVFETPAIPVSLSSVQTPIFLFRRSNPIISPYFPALSPKYVAGKLTENKQTTVNLKKVELPVKQIVSGQIIKPSGTLLNPESLEYYYQFAKLEEMVGGKSKL